jgi:penicillin-binding protein 2
VIVTPIQLARTLGGIAMGGVLHRPHVTFPDQLPDQYKQVTTQYPDEVDVAIDPRNVEIITDAMAGVTGPGGTAAAAHLEGIDFAGKTGTAQTISNEARERLKLSKNQFKDNGWFVGMTPRRNPEIVVAGVVESGGWGASTAPLVAQVIKAYVDKQRRLPTQVADSTKPAEMTGIWSTPDADSLSGEKLQAARFVLPASPARKRPSSANGFHSMAVQTACYPSVDPSQRRDTAEDGCATQARTMRAIRPDQNLFATALPGSGKE